MFAMTSILPSKPEVVGLQVRSTSMSAPVLGLTTVVMTWINSCPTLTGNNVPGAVPAGTAASRSAVMS